MAAALPRRRLAFVMLDCRSSMAAARSLGAVWKEQVIADSTSYIAMPTNIPSQKKRYRKKTLLLYDLNKMTSFRKQSCQNTSHGGCKDLRCANHKLEAAVGRGKCRDRRLRNFTRRSIVVRLMPVSCVGVSGAVRRAYRNAPRACSPAESRAASAEVPRSPHGSRRSVRV